MQVTQLTGGRGWLDAAAAASVHRIDRQLGRLADVNDAGRSAEQANANRAAWEAYRDGRGPWAPYALGADESVHCQGRAVDSDDWYNAAAAAVWRANGWRQTARYNDDRDEPWHGEYFAEQDQHINDPEPSTATPDPEEDFMKIIRWNSLHCFAVSMEAIYHIPDTLEYGELQVIHGRVIDVDNHGLTAILLSHGIHWDAVDAVLRGAAYGTNGKYWSRLMAEGIAIRGAQAAASKTLADVLATAKAIGKA